MKNKMSPKRSSQNLISRYPVPGTIKTSSIKNTRMTSNSYLRAFNSSPGPQAKDPAGERFDRVQ